MEHRYSMSGGIKSLIIGSLILTTSLLADVKQIQAARIENTSIQVDGQLKEPVWNKVSRYTEFFQRNPNEGEPATEPTEFAVLYDNTFLYVGIWAHSDDTKTIEGILSRRDDDTPSDWLYVSLDSYNDHRTAFDFGLNPVNVKRDLRRFDDENSDVNWDAIWEGEAARTADGWTAEFRIPFRELRFSQKDNLTWGIQVYRHIASKNEDDYWTYWSKEESGWVRHYGQLTGLEDIPHQQRLYVTPYITSQLNRDDALQTPFHSNNYDVLNAVGADIKYGVTNNLTLDVTLNPDFGQVEADPAELNLSALETYYSEKRPFFMEGGNIYNFTLGLGDGDNSTNTLFYSRRIGRAPHVFEGDSIGYSRNPEVTTILGAGKLSGKTDNGLSIGILDAVTARETGSTRFTADSSRTSAIEPLTHYYVNRLQKDFRHGKTTIGGMFTATNRSVKSSDSLLVNVPHDAYTAGVDMTHIFWNDSYAVQASLSYSNILGTPTAMNSIETNGIHYFQRPDAPHLSVDSTATHLSGTAGIFAISKIKGERWIWALGGWTFSPGFDSNDIGYVRSVDTQLGFVWIQLRQQNPGKVFRNYYINFNGWVSQTYGHELTSNGGNVNGSFTLLNYWGGSMGVNYDFPAMQLTALWGGPSVLSNEKSNAWFYLESDSRKDLYVWAHAYRGGDFHGTWWSGISPGFTYRPTKHSTVHGNLSYDRNHDGWANWRGFDATENLVTGESDWIMAEMDQHTLSATLRIDYILSPTMTLQFYGSPFITTGSYDHFKKLMDPKDKNWDTRFYNFSQDQITFDEENNQWIITDLNGQQLYSINNHDFNYKQLNVNMVFRWEYKTGSSLYLVWSQNGNDYLNSTGPGIGRSFGKMFSMNPGNIFMIKFSHLFHI